MTLKQRVAKLETEVPVDGFSEFFRDLIMQAQGSSLPIATDIEDDCDSEAEGGQSYWPTFAEWIADLKQAYYSGLNRSA
jgi:phage major head subunit gpT-like protein